MYQDAPARTILAFHEKHGHTHTVMKQVAPRSSVSLQNEFLPLIEPRYFLQSRVQRKETKGCARTQMSICARQFLGYINRLHSSYVTTAFLSASPHLFTVASFRSVCVRVLEWSTGGTTEVRNHSRGSSTESLSNGERQIPFGVSRPNQFPRQSVQVPRDTVPRPRYSAN